MSTTCTQRGFVANGGRLDVLPKALITSTFRRCTQGFLRLQMSFRITLCELFYLVAWCILWVYSVSCIVNAFSERGPFLLCVLTEHGKF